MKKMTKHKKASGKKPSGRNEQQDRKVSVSGTTTQKPEDKSPKQGTMSLAQLLEHIYQEALNEAQVVPFLASASKMAYLGLLNQQKLEDDLQGCKEVKETVANLTIIVQRDFHGLLTSIFTDPMVRAEIMNSPVIKKQVNALNGKLKKQVPSKRMLQDTFENILFESAMQAEKAAFLEAAGPVNIQSLLKLVKDPQFAELMSEAVMETAANSSHRKSGKIPEQPSKPSQSYMQQLAGLIWLALLGFETPGKLYQAVSPQAWMDAEFLNSKTSQQLRNECLQSLTPMLANAGVDMKMAERQKEFMDVSESILQAQESGSSGRIQQAFHRLADFVIGNTEGSAKQAVREQLKIVYAASDREILLTALRVLTDLILPDLDLRQNRESKKLETAEPVYRHALLSAYDLRKTQEDHNPKDEDGLYAELSSELPALLGMLICDVQNAYDEDPNRKTEPAGGRLVRFLQRALDFFEISWDVRNPMSMDKMIAAEGVLIDCCMDLVSKPDQQKELRRQFLEIFPEWKDRTAQSKALVEEYERYGLFYENVDIDEMETLATREQLMKKMKSRNSRMVEEFFYAITDENWRVLLPTSVIVLAAADDTCYNRLMTGADESENTWNDPRYEEIDGLDDDDWDDGREWTKEETYSLPLNITGKQAALIDRHPELLTRIGEQFLSLIHPNPENRDPITKIPGLKKDEAEMRIEKAAAYYAHAEDQLDTMSDEQLRKVFWDLSCILIPEQSPEGGEILYEGVCRKDAEIPLKLLGFAFQAAARPDEKLAAPARKSKNPGILAGRNTQEVLCFLCDKLLLPVTQAIMPVDEPIETFKEN